MQPRHSLKFCFIDGVEAAEQSPPHKSHSGHQKLDFTESYIYYIFIYVHKTYMFLLKRDTLLLLFSLSELPAVLVYFLLP